MIAIISDVHGNYPALLAVFKKIEKMKCTKIISLGDIAGYYCMINECIDLCRNKNVINILGNHDYYLINDLHCPRSHSANLCIDYQKKIITNENKKWLSKSMDKIDEQMFSMRHGGWNDPLDEYIKKFDFNKIENGKQQVFLSGHTHIAEFEKQGVYCYCNPGSVGQPRDGDNRASFITIDDKQNIQIHRVLYDIDAIADEMKKKEFDNYIYSCLYHGVRIGSV